MTEVRLHNSSLVALVDDEDFDRVSAIVWYANKKSWTTYATRAIQLKRGQLRWTTVGMHRFLLSPAPGLVVDHINGDGLDNRRANLRICTQRQNAANVHGGWGASRFKGVVFHRQSGKWQAQIQHHPHHMYLGLFSTENEAARAYDVAARELFGEFAWLNFPESHAPAPAGGDA